MADENTQAIEPAQGALPLPETATQPAETPTAQVGATEQPAADPGTSRPKDGIADRINELTKHRREAERERDYWREMAMRQKEPPAPAPEAAPTTIPTLESVGYDESKYQAALLKYAEAAATRAAESVLEKREREKAQEARTTTWQERQQKFIAKTPDYAEKVLDPSAPFSAVMSEIIMDSEVGPELAYYLANNREVAAKIARLPERLAALELGTIQGRLTQNKEANTRPTPPPKPVVSQAPPPPATLESTEGATPPVKPTDAESDKAYSDAEWIKARERQLARRKK